MKGHSFTGEGGQCELHSLIHTHLFEKTERAILEKQGKETPLQNIFKNNLHREKFENVLKTGKPTTMEQGNKPTRTPRSSARQTEQEQRCWAAGQHEGGQTRGSNQIPEGKNHYGCTHPALGSRVMGSWNLKESLNVWQLWAQGSKIQVEAH